MCVCCDEILYVYVMWCCVCVVCVGDDDDVYCGVMFGVGDLMVLCCVVGWFVLI